MLRIVFAWLALIMQLDYSSAALQLEPASLPPSAAQSLWQSRRSTTHFFFEQQLMYAWATETEDCQGREGGRLITVGYNSWRAMATASVLKLKENNYEAAEIEFLITAGRAGAAGAAARHGQGSRTSRRRWRRRKLVLTWKCLQIN